MDFAAADRLFKQDKIHELGESSAGLRFLKLRSLSRLESLNELFKRFAKDKPKGAKAMFRAAYENPECSEKIIDETIRSIYSVGRAAREKKEKALVSELYKMQAFDWGGLHQNSLEKTIVDNYVKKNYRLRSIKLASR
jgi:hypothetical protein